VPFAPHVIGKDLIFSGGLALAILTCAAVFGPSGPAGPPNPSLISTAPRPDFFFLWIFAVLALLPAYMETFLLLTAPVAIIAALVSLPFVSGTGEKSARRRPMSVLLVILTFLSAGILTWLGTYSPWSPHMEAWSGTPTPVQYLKGLSPFGVARSPDHAEQAMPQLPQLGR
jgi:ubiquinol-cytochrome c reductase cytochrome b subunit